MHGLFSHVNRATDRCVERAGCTLVEAAEQGCCGALHAHAGDLEKARELARHNIEAFERSGADFVVSNSAGCGAMMKGYAHLLHDDDNWSRRANELSLKVRDASEFLVDRMPSPPRQLPIRVTHDAPCHQMHAQRIVRQPIALLERIPAIELVPLDDADQCCGSAGIYNLIEPDTSDAVLAPKLACIRAANVQLVATGNPGCMMQIGAGLQLDGHPALRVVHPIELLDAAYEST
jgi:glycolate oxidase iron-sulfur subunit